MATVTYATVRDMAAQLAGRTLPVPASENLQILTHVAVGLRSVWAEQPWPELLALVQRVPVGRTVTMPARPSRFDSRPVVILGVYSADPRATNNWRDVGWEETGGDTILLDGDYAEVWVDYLPAKPIITDFSESYGIEERFVNYLVFYSAGQLLIADGMAQNGAGLLRLADEQLQKELGDFAIPRRFSRVRVA